MAKDDLVFMTCGEVRDAYDNFKKLFYPIDSRAGYHFWAFVGVDYAPGANSVPHGWMLPPKAAHCIRMLSGPHYETVAKAMLINGHQHKIPIEV